MADITIDALIDSSKRFDKQLPPSDNYSDGSQIVDLKDSTLYTLTDGIWVKQQMVKPGERYVVKSLDNAVYQVDDDFKLQRIFTEDIVDNSKENTIVKVFLNKYAPRTAKIFTDNNITFSSMEIMLPVILDNWDDVFKNIKFGSQAGQKELQDWLQNNGFLENNSATDKEITNEDLRNFAVLICRQLRDTGDDSVGYEGLLQKLLNTKYSINEKSYSFKDILSKLRAHDYIYPNNKDIILRNIVNHKFQLDTFSLISVPTFSGGKRQVPFGLYISEKISSAWYDLINKDELLNQIESNESIKNNFQSEIVDMKRDDIEYWKFYDYLVKILENLDSSDELYKSLKVIIDTCNPSSLIFLVERLMEESQNIQVKNLRENIISEDTDDINKLNTTLESLAISNEKLSVLRKFKALVDKYFFTKYDKRTDLIVNPNKYKSRNDMLIEDKEFISPKTLSTINTDAFKLLINDGELGVDKEKIEQKISDLEKPTLDSLAENLKNPYVIQDLTKYYTSEYIKAALKEKGAEIPEGIFDIMHQTEVVEKNNPLTGEPYKEFFMKNYGIQLSIDLEKITDLIKSAKPTIEYARTLAAEISKQDFNKPVDKALYNAEDINGNIVKVKQVQARDMLVNINFMMDSLSDYINNYKDNNLTNVNFDNIVSDMQKNPSINNLFTITYGTLINLIKTDLDPKVKQLLLLFKKYEGLVNSLKLSDLSSQTDSRTLEKLPPALVQSAQNKAKALVTHIEDYVLTTKQRKDREPKFVSRPKVKDDSRYELANYNKFLGLLRTAAANEFSLDDLEDFLKKIRVRNDALMANKNLMSQEVSKDMSLLYSTAQSIIRFLNLKAGSDINKELQIFISKASSYGAVYPSDIKIDFLKINLSDITNIISDLLNNKNTRYSYDEILNSIKGMNDKLDTTRVDKVDDNELFPVFQQLKISKFDPASINDIVNAASTQGISTSADYIISYVANKLFYLFRQTLAKGSDSKENKSSLLEYLDYQKFNLTLDIADSFSNGGFSKLVNSFQAGNLDKKYFMNAEMMFNQLKNKKMYGGLKDGEIKAMANYKVISYINLVLFDTINNYDPLKALLSNCTDWDFSDKLINNVLSQCRVYNIQGEIVDKNSRDNMLDEVKANIIKPLETKYIQNNSDNIFRSLFNKVKELNRNSLKANAVLAAKLIKSVASQKSKISFKYNDLTPKIADKLNKINLEVSSKQKELAKVSKLDKNYEVLQNDYDKLVSVQKELQTLQSSLAQQSSNIETKINDIDTIATDQLKKYIPDIKTFITDTVEKDSILMKYTNINTKFNKAHDKYSVIDDNVTSDDVLPVSIKIDEPLINEDQKLALDRNFNDETRERVDDIKYKLNTAYEVLSKLYYNSGADKLSDAKVNSLQKLLLKIDSLKESLMNKVNSKLAENKTYSDKFITKELVEQKVVNFKNDLYNKLSTIVTNSDQCFDKTEELSILLNKINLDINRTETLIDLY